MTDWIQINNRLEEILEELATLIKVCRAGNDALFRIETIYERVLEPKDVKEDPAKL